MQVCCYDIYDILQHLFLSAEVTNPALTAVRKNRDKLQRLIVMLSEKYGIVEVEENDDSNVEDIAT